jgi:hypothetical protein
VTPLWGGREPAETFFAFFSFSLFFRISLAVAFFCVIYVKSKVQKGKEKKKTGTYKMALCKRNVNYFSAMFLQCDVFTV